MRSSFQYLLSITTIVLLVVIKVTNAYVSNLPVQTLLQTSTTTTGLRTPTSLSTTAFGFGDGGIVSSFASKTATIAGKRAQQLKLITKKMNHSLMKKLRLSNVFHKAQVLVEEEQQQDQTISSVVAATTTTTKATKVAEAVVTSVTVDKVPPKAVIKTTTIKAEFSTSLPLMSRKFVEARRQPKSSWVESQLAAKYAAIESVEERAFQILLDLGMIVETK